VADHGGLRRVVAEGNWRLKKLALNMPVFPRRGIGGADNHRDGKDIDMEAFIGTYQEFIP